MWRYEVTWTADPRCAPELQIFDTYMNAIDATVHVFESRFEQHRAKLGGLACQRVASVAFAYKPLVSIVVPCYKTDRVYLSELLGLVLVQSYDNWELFLMDPRPIWMRWPPLRQASTTNAFIALSCPATAAL